MKLNTCTVDNSAILYLALMQKRHTNSYRFTMTMDQEVDPAALQQAMERIYRRFPTMEPGEEKLSITLSRFCPHPELEPIFFGRLEQVLSQAQ